MSERDPSGQITQPDIDAAVAAERERCALLIENFEAADHEDLRYAMKILASRVRSGE